jgi:hypothetical protein
MLPIAGLGCNIMSLHIYIDLSGTLVATVAVGIRVCVLCENILITKKLSMSPSASACYVITLHIHIDLWGALRQ